jgi:predicted transcriptional regulator
VIDQYIIDHYDKEPIKTIALNTGCCVRTISIRSKELRQQGLLKKEQVNKKRQFSEDELKFIMSHAGKLSTREIAQRIGRSPEMVRRKIRELRGGTHGSVHPQNAP